LEPGSEFDPLDRQTSCGSRSASGVVLRSIKVDKFFQI